MKPRVLRGVRCLFVPFLVVKFAMAIATPHYTFFDFRQNAFLAVRTALRAYTELLVCWVSVVEIQANNI